MLVARFNVHASKSKPGASRHDRCDAVLDRVWQEVRREAPKGGVNLLPLGDEGGAFPSRVADVLSGSSTKIAHIVFAGGNLGQCKFTPCSSVLAYAEIAAIIFVEVFVDSVGGGGINLVHASCYAAVTFGRMGPYASKDLEEDGFRLLARSAADAERRLQYAMYVEVLVRRHAVIMRPN